MNFGRLENVDDIDFSLPKDHPQTSRLLKSIPKDKDFKLLVGAPVWGDKGFVGKIYPPKTKQADFLSHYSKQFNCIEMNGTFYKIPQVSDVLKWKEQVAPDFIFCPKISQIITHSLQKDTVTRLTEEFCNSISHFEENLGLTFLMTPPHFKPDKLKFLERFLVQFPKEIPLSVELRHPNWFKDPKLTADVFDMFEELNISTIITDVSGRRDVLHQRLTTPTAAIRFGANDLHETDFQRMDDWIKRIKSWKSKGIKTVYFWLHTPKKSLTAELAHYFITEINLACKVNLTPPKIIKTKTKK